MEKLAISYGYDVRHPKIINGLCRTNLYGKTNQTRILECHKKEKLCDMGQYGIVKLPVLQQFMQDRYAQTIEKACPGFELKLERTTVPINYD